MDYLLQFEDLTRSFISHLNIGLPTLPGVDLTAPETVGDLNLGSTFGDINLGSDFSSGDFGSTFDHFGSTDFGSDFGGFGSTDLLDLNLGGLNLPGLTG